MPTFDELYDLHAPKLYGMALRFTNNTCAERALCDASLELWGTAAKRSQPYTVPNMVRVVMGHVKQHSLKAGNGIEFEKRLTMVMEELKDRGASSPLGNSGLNDAHLLRKKTLEQRVLRARYAD